MAKPCSARMVMPWLETVPVEERIRFIGDALSDRFTMSELCARYGVSRRVGYKWLAPGHLSPGKRDPCEWPAQSRTVVIHVPLPGIFRRFVEECRMEARCVG